MNIFQTLYSPIKGAFLAFDKKVDGSISFFIKHYGKSRFMVAMSKKAQYLGLENLWNKGPKAFGPLYQSFSRPKYWAFLDMAIMKRLLP